MNITSIRDEDQWWNDIQVGNKGAALFIIAYIGFYGLSIIFFFAQQLKETQRQRQELPAYFLKSLWDVPNKNKLYRKLKIDSSVKRFVRQDKTKIVEELADIDRLKHIFRGYFTAHQSYASCSAEDLQAIVDERAHACAIRYREKLRRLHLSHTDYYLDTIQKLVGRVSMNSRRQEKRTHEDRMLSISVV